MMKGPIVFSTAATATAIAFFCSGCGSGTPATKQTLPSPMVAGYTSGANATQIIQAVNSGVNAIFWSFMLFSNNSLHGDINSEMLGPVITALDAAGHSNVTHILSFGGWDAPHKLGETCGTATLCSATAYAAAFRAFNDEMKANVSGFKGFAGLDWDAEGNDDLSNANNVFTEVTLEIMLNISNELKDDYIVTMVPAQSYFDCEETGFSTSLKFQAEQAPQGWTYHGKNVYTVLYAKCPDCFDAVMIQLYEGYSRAGFQLYWDGKSSNVDKDGWPRIRTDAAMQQVIANNMQCLVTGWKVDFDGFMGLGNGTLIQLPAEKVVMGVGNGWLGPESGTGGTPFKCPFFGGAVMGEAWCNGVNSSNGDTLRVGGFAYWDIRDDPNGSPAQVAMIPDLSAALGSCQAEAPARKSGIIV